MAQNNLSQMFHDGQVCEKSLKKKVYWLTLAANQGYIDAQCNLGFLILDGEIPSRSREDGMLLIQNAASRGQSYAQSRLAEEYLKESDLTSSLYWFKRAALQNYSTAQFNLAVILIKSNQEIPTAMFWLRKAAGSGYNIATKLLKKREVEIALKCGACFKSLNGTGKKCTKCKSVYYCNKNCQIKDWKESHKKDCIDEISE